ncbi:MAG: hypothetical protein ACRDLB_11170 [Actinomycetota bacterium]
MRYEHILAHESAAGAATEDLIPATIVAVVMLAGLAAFGVAHRRGRTKVLTNLASFSERVSGLPGWTALPLSIATGALLVAVFGFYWDVATHIDNGRDPGPFANPSHFLIIGGLAGIALAGYAAVLLGRDEDPTAVRIRPGWYAPVGGLLLLLCGGVAVMGFPLDDVWHRLFGQDVTLWSPTHIQMVGGASLSTLALWVLFVEGRRAAGDVPKKSFLFASECMIAGAFLIGLSALQAEFDYSVPQFRLLFHPILLMASAGVVLVAARIKLGKGAALLAVGFFLLVRGIVSAAVGPLMDHTTLHFPLYLAEALAIEAIALRVSTDRQLRFAAFAGVAVGTVGLAAEWMWSHLWMTMSWPASLFPEGAILGFIAAIAGSVLGGYIGRALLEPGRPRQFGSKALAVATTAGIVLVLVYPFPAGDKIPGSATVAVTPAEREGWGTVEVAMDPPSTADDSEWFNVTSWQGGGSVVQELDPTGDGTYAAADPVPLTGEWKTQIRLHDDRSLMAVPIYLPEDPVIPAEGVPVPAPNEARALESDKELLLREAKDVSYAVTFAASSALALLVALWIAAMAWGLRRIEGSPTGSGRAAAPERGPQTQRPVSTVLGR